jgi:hypothetical protein
MTDSLTPVDEAGFIVIEGAPGQPILAGAGDVDRLLEACFGAECGAALLYAENLPAAFFDLSSGAAGVILQKLRQYGVRLAVVRGAAAEAASSPSGELMHGERTRRDFGIFASRTEARSWLASRRAIPAHRPTDRRSRRSGPACVVHSQLRAGHSAAERRR